MLRNLEEYKTLVGKSPRTPTLPKMITEKPSLLENSIKVALENDLGLKVLMLEEKALEEELRALEKSRLPNLSLSGALSYGDSPTLEATIVQEEYP